MKTANVQILQRGTAALREVAVKKTFEHAGEVFFIHRGVENDTWTVSHYRTGFSVVKNATTIKAAEEKFFSVMEQQEKNLQTAITHVMKRYGAANELPEGKK